MTATRHCVPKDGHRSTHCTPSQSVPIFLKLMVAILWCSHSVSVPHCLCTSFSSSPSTLSALILSSLVGWSLSLACCGLVIADNHSRPLSFLFLSLFCPHREFCWFWDKECLCTTVTPSHAPMRTGSATRLCACLWFTLLNAVKFPIFLLCVHLIHTDSATVV